MGESYGDIKSAMPRLGRSFSSLQDICALRTKEKFGLESSACVGQLKPRM